MVQNGGLLNPKDTTPGQKELPHWSCEGWLLIYYGVGEVRKREGLKELSYAKEDLQDTRGFPIVNLRLFFLLVRH